MKTGLVTGLRSIELGVTDVGAQRKFYTGLWNLAVAAEADDSVYLRGTGAAHHILALHPRERTELISFTLTAASRANVDLLAGRVKAAGMTVQSEPAQVVEPGGGYAFTFLDPEGRRVRVIAGDQKHGDVSPVKDRPERLSHVVFNSADATQTRQFYVDVLGFRLSDHTKIMEFIRCDNEHHNIALVYSNESTVNHIAFMMPDLDSVMRGAGRMRDGGYPIEWGVGRHGPGNNVFAYFLGPGEVPIEYTSEVEQVDETYETHGPDYWKWPPGRIDHWGISEPPSDRLKVAQHALRFAAT